MANPLEQILGLGYSGYAILNGVPILLLPSSGTEEDNLLTSQAAFSTVDRSAAGVMPSVDRRSLPGTIETIVCPATAPLIRDYTYGIWRDAPELALAIPLDYVFANGEGYRAQIYIDSLRVTAPDGQALTLSINFTSWIWEDLGVSTPTLRDGRQLAPLSDDYKPVPSWQTTLSTNLVDVNTIPTDWSITFTNNWQYETLLEANTFFPPNPTNIYPGPLDTEVSISWLATRRNRPRESGNLAIHIGQAPYTPGGRLLDINMPLVYRAKNRVPSAFGEPNAPAKWQATYQALDSLPN